MPRTRNSDVEIPEVPLDLRGKLDPKNLSWDLYIRGCMTEEKVAGHIQHLLALDNSNIPGEINIFLLSGGGETSAGYALIDIMTSCKHTIRTIALGDVCSMAAFTFIAGTPGNRIIGQRALLMFHPISSTHIDTAQPYLEDSMVGNRITKSYGDALLNSRTSITKEAFEKQQNGELWLRPAEAIQMNMAEKMITDSKVIDKIYSKLRTPRQAREIKAVQ